MMDPYVSLAKKTIELYVRERRVYKPAAEELRLHRHDRADAGVSFGGDHFQCDRCRHAGPAVLSDPGGGTAASFDQRGCAGGGRADRIEG